MRGKVCFVALVVNFLGITPAYAGKSFDVEQHLPGVEDHPRVCGEKSWS